MVNDSPSWSAPGIGPTDRVPVKFWVSTYYLSLLAGSPGVYTIGLYDSPNRNGNRPSIPFAGDQDQPADAAYTTAVPESHVIDT